VGSGRATRSPGPGLPAASPSAAWHPSCSCTFVVVFFSAARPRGLRIHQVLVLIAENLEPSPEAAVTDLHVRNTVCTNRHHPPALSFFQPAFVTFAKPSGSTAIDGRPAVRKKKKSEIIHGIGSAMNLLIAGPLASISSPQRLARPPLVASILSPAKFVAPARSDRGPAANVVHSTLAPCRNRCLACNRRMPQPPAQTPVRGWCWFFRAKAPNAASRRQNPRLCRFTHAYSDVITRLPPLFHFSCRLEPFPVP